ncbi:ankyrin repeat domain-containing protein [uncultured Treponema sp.]|uniref:ankyrin repeat domain-containing protein n=1 Tax=uncultured Treponema sp. TaxID=162155 RepID=UPI0015BFC3D6|nr:ankyrin repeat domain-containing protein [uncultured Treponema sp.]
MKFCKKKGIFIFVLVFFSVLSVWGSGKRDRLFDTVENGTEKEIKAALRKDPDYANVKRGKEKETLLMSALKEDRELSVINILLKYGADPMEKDAQKRNSLMYAAKFSSSPEVLERLVKVNSIFNFSRKNKILKKDRNGKTTLDYAEENPSPEKMLAVLRKYVKEKEKKQSPEPEEELSREQIEQIQSETPEESISQEAGKDDSTEEQMEVPSENPDAQQEADSGEQVAEE